jgi:hypothetical protein
LKQASPIRCHPAEVAKIKSVLEPDQCRHGGSGAAKVSMKCPRCKTEIQRDFYCLNCGYVPLTFSPFLPQLPRRHYSPPQGVIPHNNALLVDPISHRLARTWNINRLELAVVINEAMRAEGVVVVSHYLALGIDPIGDCSS